MHFSYNLLNLPAQIKSGSTVKANYTYLSDGTKAAAYTSASAGKDYVGSFVYARDANGTRTLESVAFGGKEEQDGAFGVAYSDFGTRSDNDDHFWKSIGTGVDYVIGAGASAITGFSPVIPSLLGLTAPIASMVDNVISEKSKENSNGSEVELTNLSFDSKTNYLWDPNHLYLSF